MKLFSITLMFILAGCGSSDDTSSGSSEASVEKNEESVFDPMVDTLDKAREVEDIVMQQKEQMDEALKRMEGETEE